KPKDAKKGPAKSAEPKEIADLRALGANLEMDGRTVVGVSFFKAKITDAALARVAAVKGLRSLDLTGTAITDAGLGHLKGLRDLTRLDLRRTKVTDAGLAHLQGLTALEHLNLSETGVSTNLLPLRKLTKLKTLNLARSGVGDVALTHVGAMGQLETL